MKKILVLMLTVVMLITLGTLTAFATETEDTAEANYVAQVGSVNYETIEEAITAWTNGTTLTLLSDVTLSDVITIKSTEKHILNLSTYTLTAANGKNVFEIQACGTGSQEKTAILITADEVNPGSINAGKKAVVFYDYSKGGISAEDRPIIEIAGGTLNGSTNTFAFGSNVGGIHVKGTAARKCATIKVTGGTLNCSIYGTGKSKLVITGGTFNAGIYSQGDSTACRLISGGRFKTITFMTADSNNTKFWIGTKMGVSNVGVYVDKYGYLVVGGDVITEAGDRFEASSTNYSGWSSYLQYSSAAKNGLFYETVEEAFADNNKTSGLVTVYTDSLDLTSTSYKGSITVANEVSDFSIDLTGNKTFNGTINVTNEETIVSVVYDKETVPAWTVDSHAEGKIIVYADVEISTLAQDSTGMLVRNYFVYENLQEAINDAIDGDIIVLADNIVLEAGIVVGKDKNITIDLNGKTITYQTSTMNDHMIKNNGTLTIDDTVGGGVLSYTYTGEADTSYTKSNTTIVNAGTLVINNGTIQNNTQKISHVFYAIDSNSINTDASLTINGGKIVCQNNRAVRLAAGSHDTSIEINGGEIEGSSVAVYVQMFGTTNDVKPNISMEVNGGVITSDYALYTYSHGASFENTTLDITNGTFNGYVALGGGENKQTSETVNVTGGSFNSDFGIFSYANHEKAVENITITGGEFTSNYSEIYATDDGYTFESSTDENGNTVYGVSEAKVEDIFTFKGYSVCEDGIGVTVSYSIDKTLFEAYCQKNGVDITLGAVYSVGTIDEYAIYKSFEGLRLTTNYNITLKDMKAEHAEILFVMALYIEINGEKQFVTGNQDNQTVIVDAISVEAITYKGVLESQSKEDAE